MSRFSLARRAAIATWTGASVVWATTWIVAGLEPQREGSADPSASATLSHASPVAIPNLPASGLIVIRAPGIPDRADSGDSESTVPVDRPPAPQPVTDPAPRPVSSGS